MTHFHKDHAIKTRFCPSPTGRIHLGNARTALFSALFAKKMDGTFLLRIEDTDRERSRQEYADGMMDDLRWMHLYWQEGPGTDHEEHGPYYQSQRQFIYDDYYERLIVAGMAYPCFCSNDELALARKIQLASGQPPRYSGACYDLSPEQLQEKYDRGLKPVLRFRVCDDEVIEYDDFVRGKQKFSTTDIGDFIIRRADGTSPFMYVNAIDDSLMEVTHVMRGEDHIANTPRQLMILQALGLRAPQYGHISLIMGEDGTPLSKRNGSRSIEELRCDGYLYEAVVNYLARLGHYYGHDHLLSLDALAEQFTLEGLSKSPAKFNAQQLDYWQKQAVSQAELNVLWAWLSPQEQQLVPDQQRDAFLELMKQNSHYPHELQRWVLRVFGELPELDEAQQQIVQEAGKAYFIAALDAVEKYQYDVKHITQHISEQVNVKGKKLFQPLRVVLTGDVHGPDLGQLLVMMDLDEIKKRLKKAEHYVKDI